MPKNRKSNREDKKKPASTMKEKREVKKAKKDTSVFSINDRSRNKAAAQQRGGRA
ncbi:MAG: hypothetical protein ACU84Q_04125 [Gammaproteobacteria bacterium]